MIPHYPVFVGDQPGHCDLMAGDIVRLERLLPELSAVQRLGLVINGKAQLTPDEARELLTGLRGLDPSKTGIDLYYRSTSGPVKGSTRELIGALIRFLDGELKILGGTAR